MPGYQKVPLKNLVFVYSMLIHRKYSWAPKRSLCTSGVTKVLLLVLSPTKSPRRGRAEGTGGSGPKRPSSTAVSMGRRMKLLRDVSNSQASSSARTNQRYPKIMVLKHQLVEVMPRLTEQIPQ